MLKIFICEDCNEQKNRLEKYIKDLVLIEEYDMKVELATTSPTELLDRIRCEDNSGLYFLDVNLKSELNGISLAEKIREYDPRGFITFITSHAEMSYLTFLYRIEAMDFIIKRGWSEVRDRVKASLIEADKRYKSRNNKQQQVFSINLNDRVISFNYDEILFIETSSNIHKLVLHADNNQVEFYGKMKDVEVILDENFVRVHKSYLVNINRIKEIDKRNKIIYMSNGESCLASVRLIKNLSI